MRLPTLLLIVPALPLLACSSTDGSAPSSPQIQSTGGTLGATGGATGTPKSTGGAIPTSTGGATGIPPTTGGTAGIPTLTGGAPGSGSAPATSTGGAAAIGTGGALATGGDSNGSAWAPAPPTAGYTRLVAKTIPNIPPGGDVTHCQYLAPPLDHDTDIVAVLGFQSEFGHHATAFEYTPKADEPVGNDFPCMGSEFSGDPASLAQLGPFLGAVGAAGKPSTSSLPDGVAFRHRKGKGIMLSVHFVNTGTRPIDGNAVIDLQMVDADPSRTIATMFANVSTNVTLPPQQETTSVVECLVWSDLEFLMMGNHMHEYGSRAFTQIVHPDGTTQDMHTDKTWNTDQSFNPIYEHFPLASPLVVRTGDKIRTSCTWKNGTTAAIEFPREMCTASGFILQKGSNSPMCYNGLWLNSTP